MAKRKPVSEIARKEAPGERELTPQRPSNSWADGDARGTAHVQKTKLVKFGEDMSTSDQL